MVSPLPDIRYPQPHVHLVAEPYPAAYCNCYLYPVVKKIKFQLEFTLIALLILTCSLSAQRKRNMRDSIVASGFISADYGYNIPGGNLADRFGNNSTIGAYAGYKTRKNNFYAIEWNYIFGEDIKEYGILDSISTSDGYLIDQEGKLADIRIFERGFTLHAQYGHVFPIAGISPNRNSGLYITGGVGMMQHKLRIYDNGGRSPQLSGDYLKGYDRMTSGVSFSQFVGYWYMSNNRFVNLYIGFEAYEAFTKSRRSWDYDLMRADTQKRVDLMYGARIGWVIPLYRRHGKDEYI